MARSWLLPATLAFAALLAGGHAHNFLRSGQADVPEALEAEPDDSVMLEDMLRATYNSLTTGHQAVPYVRHRFLAQRHGEGTSTPAPDSVTVRAWERGKLEEAARAREQEEQPAGSGQQFCNFRLCHMCGSEAPLLFVKEFTDGAGHRMKGIMDGLATAVKNNMNFGGVLEAHYLVTEQGHDFHSLANRILGDGTPNHLFITERPNFTEEFQNLAQLEEHRPRLEPRALVYLPDATKWSSSLPPGASSSIFYSDDLREALRQELALVPLMFAPRRPTVALHVRRGDLPKGHKRCLPDEYYFRLVDRIRGVLPAADVHAWSSVQGYSAMGNKTYWSYSDFDSFRQRGMTVHLDGDDLMVPWAHLSQAHVLVMATSSFSYVPAVLNPHCVIYQEGKPLFPGWLDSDKLDGSPGDGLESCVRSAWSQK